MSNIDLSKVNLNLLLALDALLSEVNVTHAGDRLGISQSAMSHSLNQLREITGDQLLIRGQSSKMVLSPLAVQLRPKVKTVIREIESVLSGNKEIDLKSEKRTFTIGCSDYVSMVLLPKVAEIVSTSAPGVTLVIRHLNTLKNLDLFESGKMDLAIGNFGRISDFIYHQKIFTDESVCVAHKSHPAFQKNKVSIKEYAKYPHILVGLESEPNESYIASLMLKAGYQINVTAIVPHTLTPLYTLRPGTNFIASTVLKIAKAAKSQSQLSIKPMPLDVPDYECFQYWHPKDNQDPLHKAVRNIVKEVGKSI